MDEIDKLKDGDHFWAMGEVSKELSVFVIDSGNIFIAGNWEGSFSKEELIFVEKITKPNI